MSEMVERVAKAIGEEVYGWVDPVETPNTWRSSVSLARTAIAAMRVPDPAMVEGGYAASARCDCMRLHDFVEAWHAMIDAALADAQK